MGRERRNCPRSAFKSIIARNGGNAEPEQAQAAKPARPASRRQAKGRPKADRETKKRVSLALYPSSYSDLQKIAYVNRQSVSDIVSELIAEYVNANAAKLKEYEKIKPE